MTRGCPGTKPVAGLVWLEEEVVITLPPGPNVVWTGVWYPELSPGEEVRVEEAGLELGPAEDPGRPGLGRKAIGLTTTLP